MLLQQSTALVRSQPIIFSSKITCADSTLHSSAGEDQQALQDRTDALQHRASNIEKNLQNLTAHSAAQEHLSREDCESPLSAYISPFLR